MFYIITEEQLNKIINLLGDKPFREVIALLDEIKKTTERLQINDLYNSMFNNQKGEGDANDK